MGRRGGFAMLSVLWVLALAGGLALGAAGEGRVALDAARNRIAVERGAWAARGCLAILRARLDASYLGTREGEPRALWWRTLDRAVTEARRPDDGCTLAVEPLGVRVDVNSAVRSSLIALLRATGPAASAEARAAAILDWRDPDDDARAGGTESAWYRAQGQPLPRNAPFESAEELRFVRGFSDDTNAMLYLGTELSRISLFHASGPVLATLPGVSPEVVRHILTLRRDPARIATLHELVGTAPAPLRPALLAAFAELSLRATLEPDGWRLVATAQSEGISRTVSVEQVVRLGGAGPFVTRERSW